MHLRLIGATEMNVKLEPGAGLRAYSILLSTPAWSPDLRRLAADAPLLWFLLLNFAGV